MIGRAQRNLQLVGWSHDLNLYAAGLTGDRNVSFLIVHQTLLKAFAAPVDERSATARYAALRLAIDDRFVASQAGRRSRPPSA